MTRGLIEGKAARKYDKKKKSDKSKLFDKFILANVKNNSKICDLCCGSGNVIELLRDKSKEIIGIDASSEMIKICKEKFHKNKNITVYLSSATKTNEKDNYFDYVIIRDGLHHIKDKKSVIDETFRILKSKGKLILIDRYYNNKLIYHIKEILRLILRFDKHIINSFIISKEENLKLIKDFKMIKEEYSPGPLKRTSQKFMFILEK